MSFLFNLVNTAALLIGYAVLLYLVIVGGLSLTVLATEFIWRKARALYGKD